MLPLTAAELDKRLDYLLNPVLSTRRTAAPLAHALATLDRSLQDFTLHWVEVIGRTNYEMAYQFAAAAPAAMAALDREAAEAWIIQAMDSYDYEGLHHGTLAFKNFRTFITHANAHQAVYDDVAPVLELFVCGLSGRRMKFDSAPVAWTDTDTLYLPPYMAAGVDHAHNFLIYKIMVTLLWAQSRFGTFSANLDEAVQRHSDPTRALEWLSFLESVRLEAQIARVLPGLARDLAGLRGEASDGDERYAPLRSASASVQDSIALLNTLPLTDPAPHHAWSGTLRPAHAMATRAARLAREKNALQSALAAFIDEQSQAGLDANNAESAVGDIKINVKAKPGENGEMEFELQLGGTPIAPPDVVRNLLNSIIQDLGEVPDDYLTPAADNIAYHPAGKGTDDAADTGNDVDLHDNTARLYNEWDYQRHHYRKNWCVLRELDVHPGDDTFVGATLNKYAPQVAQLRRPRLQRLGIELRQFGLHARHLRLARHPTHTAGRAHHATHHLAEHALLLGHHLHHIGHLAVLLEELVDLLGAGSRTGRYSPLALAVQHLRIAPFLRGHGRDHRPLALDRLLIDP